MPDKCDEGMVPHAPMSDGGGGSSGLGPLYKSNMMVGIMHDGEVKCIKNRYGDPNSFLYDKNSVFRFISTILSNMTIKKDGSYLEEGMQQELKEAMHKIIKKYEVKSKIDIRNF